LIKNGAVLLASAISLSACGERTGGVDMLYMTETFPIIGIPTPDFGLTEQAPPLPNPWTAEVPGFYFIDRSTTGSSDSRTYGRPGAARLTIPKSVPAGAVVVIRGNYNQTHSSPNQIKLNGTKEQPVFIKSDAGVPGVPMRGWQVWGSYYVIEGLEWKLAASSESKPPCVKFLSPTDRGVLRGCKLGGNLTGGGIQVVSSSAFVSGSETKNVLVIRNDIHDSGDVASTSDQDIHSVNIGGKVSNVWIGTQVNAGSATAQPNLHHIYLGKNHVYRTRQAGLAVKQAVDVIISQNKIHDVINTSWSPSKGLGYQYAPERVWMIYNEVYNCTYGLHAGSDSGQGIGKSDYIIGNLFYNIHRTGGDYNANTAWSHAAIMLSGGINRYVVGNTIHDADGGIYCPGSGGKCDVIDNIVSKITEPGGAHIFVEFGATATASAMKNNLFYEVARLKWGNATPKTLAQFKAAYSPKGEGSLEADPRFVDVAASDYDLQATSSAISAGAETDVYEVFKTTYGIDIQVDMEGRPRPAGPAWDIGAYEVPEQEPIPPDPTDPCADVKAENEELKAANAQLTSENEQLKQEVLNLTTENTTLTERIDSAISVLQQS
jgi:hypothetical protein